MSYYVDTMREIAQRISEYFDRRKEKKEEKEKRADQKKDS